jgi:pimeloyl-ACP methyl ester carboxylesterase
MKIKSNGIEINYELSGQGDCLVLIHGFSDNLTMWYNQIPGFSKQYKVLSYDVRGHGETETPEGNYSMELFADDLYTLLKNLKIDKACVLGYSMGGRIGLVFALKHPEMTTGLVFANSGVMGPDLQMSPEDLKQMEEQRVQMIGILESGDIDHIAEVMAQFSLSPGFKEKEPEIFQNYKSVKMKNDPHHYAPIMQALMKSMENPPDLSQLKCPALIIAGEHDGFMSLEVAKSMKAAIPNATVSIFPTGHASAIETPKAFNHAVLDFMENL